ncbi:MAG: hypothetical protein AAB893_03265 [Patescibacteria group bacterium]|mgnify:CR=1 FL=1
MNRKFLSMALVTAMLTLLVVPSAFAASSNATVTVTANTTLTLSLAGQMSAATFSDGLDTVTQNDSQSKAWTAGTDKFTVVDWTGHGNGKAGHHVQIKFNTKTWTFNSATPGQSKNGLVYTIGATPSTDQAYFYLGTATGSFAAKTGACTATDTKYKTSAGTNSVVIKGRINQTIATTANTCAGTIVYPPARAIFVGSSNYLGDGSYTINGTVTLTDAE